MTQNVSRRSRGFGLLDLVVVVGVLLLVVAFFLPMRTKQRGDSSRVKCSSNLRQIGQGLLLYSNENRQAYPRVRFDASAPVSYYTGVNDNNPFDGQNDPSPNDVTAALYLLPRTLDMGTEVFTCPSSQEMKFSPKDTIANYSNFPSQKHLSFALANPYPTTVADAKGYKWDATLGPEFAVVADMGPGVDMSTLTQKSSQNDVRKANSTNHDRDGQNVLFGDGHVEFTSTPLVGVNKDNIYAPAAALVVGKDGSASLPPGTVPQHADDSVLLPSEKD
ncbi:MAG TPA: hypothetical protein VGN72_06490 [Tepidisphaeraceae bacterium]|jgi:prepilin-type processing-associated H-X9-DG protein|nr:hypothetical protein [Tepidisphaeraceae bacterium]